MKLNISSLADIDPSRVPLPHGTEVTTVTDHWFAGKLIPQGAVGRIKSCNTTCLLVQIVGVGLVEFERSELIVRKTGQLNYAIKREFSWQSLHPNIVLETVVGSKAWGLDDEASDTDTRGLYVFPFSWTIGLAQAPSDFVSADGSHCFWEVGKGFTQALRADPNTLEMLHVPGAEARDCMGQWILEAKDAFVSAEIYGTFGRYALSQLKRLRQNLRLAEHRALLLTWLRNTPGLDLDVAAKRLAHETGLDSQMKTGSQQRARQYIKQLYGSMFDQGILQERNYASLVLFAQSNDATFDLPRELRPKNAYNLLRLLHTASHWLRSGTPEFKVHGTFRDELMAIKKSQWPMVKILDRAQDMAADLEEARLDTILPKHPDRQAVDILQRRLREESAKRWYSENAGPFGKDAPPFPLVKNDS